MHQYVNYITFCEDFAKGTQRDAFRMVRAQIMVFSTELYCSGCLKDRLFCVQVKGHKQVLHRFQLFGYEIRGMPHPPIKLSHTSYESHELVHNQQFSVNATP